MPKISDTEKHMIHEKLFTEGEKLFITHGIKKVTVDDLVKAAGIAKGSFYSYYPSKEYLYMDIVSKLQEKMWIEMDVFLEENAMLPPRELTKHIFIWMLKRLDQYPMLQLTDGETTRHLLRKLPKEAMEAHNTGDKQELIKLQKYGIYFSYDLDLVSKVLQTLAITFLDLKEDNPVVRESMIDIILSGVLNQIVRDEK